MKRRILALIVLSIFVLATASACVHRHGIGAPGQFKKHGAPGRR